MNTPGAKGPGFPFTGATASGRGERLSLSGPRRADGFRLRLEEEIATDHFGGVQVGIPYASVRCRAEDRSPPLILVDLSISLVSAARIEARYLDRGYYSLCQGIRGSQDVLPLRSVVDHLVEGPSLVIRRSKVHDEQANRGSSTVRGRHH